MPIYFTYDGETKTIYGNVEPNDIYDAFKLEKGTLRLYLGNKLHLACKRGGFLPALQDGETYEIRDAGKRPTNAVKPCRRRWRDKDEEDNGMQMALIRSSHNEKPDQMIQWDVSGALQIHLPIRRHLVSKAGPWFYGVICILLLVTYLFGPTILSVLMYLTRHTVIFMLATCSWLLRTAVTFVIPVLSGLIDLISSSVWALLVNFIDLLDYIFYALLDVGRKKAIKAAAWISMACTNVEFGVYVLRVFATCLAIYVSPIFYRIDELPRFLQPPYRFLGGYYHGFRDKMAVATKRARQIFAFLAPVFYGLGAVLRLITGLAQFFVDRFVR
ncbi:unnamed protein product, partial [Mesorhabditis spiculigera]